MSVMVIVIVSVVLLGSGGAYYGPRAGWGGSHYGGGLLGLGFAGSCSSFREPFTHDQDRGFARAYPAGGCTDDESDPRRPITASSCALACTCGARPARYCAELRSSENEWT
jgi:hypothetical protein